MGISVFTKDTHLHYTGFVLLLLLLLYNHLIYLKKPCVCGNGILHQRHLFITRGKTLRCEALDVSGFCGWSVKLLQLTQSQMEKCILILFFFLFCCQLPRLLTYFPFLYEVIFIHLYGHCWYLFLFFRPTLQLKLSPGEQ